MAEFIVTPWEVEGSIDYNKLIQHFGLQPMPSLPKEFQEEILFRRKVVFAHRDFDRILNCIKSKKPFVMMTGLMPTGRFHIGHMLVARQIIFYQNLGAKIYLAVADIEAYNARDQSFEESRRIAIEEYIANYFALGLKQKNLDLYFQSARSKDAVKSNAYYRLQNILANHVTFNEFKAVYGEITPGKMLSSLLQASDMLHPQLNEFEGKIPVIVPVGPDQDPHIRLTRDIISRFSKNFIQLSSTYHIFMPGLKGGKMSASDPSSFIALSDTIEDIKTKIKKYAFSGGQATIEEHRKKGGNPDVDVSFQYMKLFFEPYDKKLEKIYYDYKTGKLLTGELKEMLIEKLTTFIKKHQIEMNRARKSVEKFIESRIGI